MLSQAQSEPVGYVKSVVGDAWVSSAGQSVKAEPGTAILLGSALRTGAGASMGVALKDRTVMSIGANSELTLDEYVYTPTPDQLKFTASLVKGTLNYRSGLIAKIKPDAVSIKTPGGVIGAGAAQFLVQVGN
jgi:hypothetical protein